MKIRELFIPATVCILALAVWFLHAHNSPRVEVAKPAAEQVSAPAEEQELDFTEPAEAPGKYPITVNRGLEYLAKHQFPDGHWEGDDGQHPVAMTGLVGLALHMEGSTVHKGQYSANIRQAANWLAGKSQKQAGRDGLIFSEHPSETSRYMYGHGLATLFLAGAYHWDHDRERRARLNDILTRAARYIASAQSTQGGWYHTSKVEGHDFAVVAASVPQIQALQALRVVSIEVPEGVESDGQEYLKMAVEKYELAAKPADRGRLADTAAALAGRFRHEAMIAKDELAKTWFTYCHTETAIGRDELIHYYFAQAVFNLGDDGWQRMFNVEPGSGLTWSGYRTALFDYLRTSQNKDGSWPAGDGLSIGPVYSTALWCTVLQLDKRRHPSRELRMMPKGLMR